MAHLPVLRELAVSDYLMYPGTPAKNGLQTTFEPGLTLIIGTNGLGKSTLVNLVLRMLTGPYDIRDIGTGTDLGSRNIEARALSSSERQTFAGRVRDGAESAQAQLSFTIGQHSFEIVRSLTDLGLTSYSIDAVQLEPDEVNLQKAICKASETATFGDWILLLRLLVFYFEDRRALVWDKSAQVQLLRILFLTPSLSGEWSERFREILESDSYVRNLTYIVNKEAKRAARSEKAVGSLPEIRQQLSLLSEQQQYEESRLSEASENLAPLSADKKTARLHVLRTEQALETMRRSLDRLELLEVHRAFPTGQETAQYLVSHIVTSGRCLTCSSEVPGLADKFRQRATTGLCPICASPTDRPKHKPTDVAEMDRLRREVNALDEELHGARLRHGKIEDEHRQLLAIIEELTNSTSERAGTINHLQRSLPPSETAVHESLKQLRADQARLEANRQHLDRLRASFTALQDGVNTTILEGASEVKEAFDQYANEFLLEECALTWSLFRDRIGQGGHAIDFPAFEMELGGAGFDGPVRRSGPDHVSESQREFIDLSFRMALVDAATAGNGTIIIDAPESSLDAVFSRRAARVLTSFATSGKSKRLLVTSNLIDGNLIPELIVRNRIPSAASPRVVDLLSTAAPTAALDQMRQEYTTVRDQLFAQGEQK